MCLYSKTVVPKIAMRDIPIYKELKLLDTGLLITPYYRMPINNSCIKAKGNLIIETIRSLMYHDRFDNYYKIGKGFIHCYNSSEHHISKNYLYYKGYIPKGTLYYEDGYYNNGEICARKIIIEKKVMKLNNKTQQDFLNLEWCKKLTDAGIDMSDAKYSITKDNEIIYGNEGTPTYTLAELLYKLNEWPINSKGLKFCKDAPFYIFYYENITECISEYPIEAAAQLLLYCAKNNISYVLNIKDK